MLPPKLAVMYQVGFPNAAMLQFAETMNDENLTVHVEERPPSGPMAGLLWTMVTVGAAFISSNYFGGIFKELGKEHYEKLKKALGELTQKTMTTPRIEPVLFNTVGKINEDDPYTMAFSIYANLPDGKTAKLLLPKAQAGLDYTPITNAFLDFVARCYEEESDALDETGFDESRVFGGGQIIVAYNPDTCKMEWIDPRPKPTADC
jgi:hypothetical protein